jgi:hypothetical protein
VRDFDNLFLEWECYTAKHGVRFKPEKIVSLAAD